VRKGADRPNGVNAMFPGRHAMIEVPWARVPTRKVVLEAGRTLRVGSTSRADFVIPNDVQMSAAHFALSWDGERCRLTDLASAKGTLLDGVRVAAGEVKSGAWIRAGATDVSVYLEEATPPWETPAPMPTAEKERALAVLSAEEAPLFAVLDASRDLRVLQLMRESVEEYQSLYEGVKGHALALTAPYLVRLPRGSRLLRRLVLEAFGRRWGMFLTCWRPFKEVRRHLRRFLLVEDDQTGKKMYFRFYDGKVLGAFLPTCTLRQRQDLFGEIGAFLLEREDGSMWRHVVGQSEGERC
jgi:hypothetical protein